jgi:hypothetical protein
MTAEANENNPMLSPNESIGQNDDTNSQKNNNDEASHNGKKKLSLLTRALIKPASLFIAGLVTSYALIALASKNPFPWLNSNSALGPVNSSELAACDFNLTGMSSNLHNNSEVSLARLEKINTENQTDSEPTWYTGIMNSDSKNLSTAAQEFIQRAEIEKSLDNPLKRFKSLLTKKELEKINAMTLDKHLSYNLEKYVLKRGGNIDEIKGWMKGNRAGLFKLWKKIVNNDPDVASMSPQEKKDFAILITKSKNLEETQTSLKLANEKHIENIYVNIKKDKFCQSPVLAAASIATHPIVNSTCNIFADIIRKESENVTGIAQTSSKYEYHSMTTTPLVKSSTQTASPSTKASTERLDNIKENGLLLPSDIGMFANHKRSIKVGRARQKAAVKDQNKPNKLQRR